MAPPYRHPWKRPMTDSPAARRPDPTPDTAPLSALHARLLAEAAHHGECVGLSRIPEGAQAHDGIRAGLEIAATYVAAMAAGQPWPKPGHKLPEVTPQQEAA